ncbi:hypothetical protein CYMTET_7542 [Cymbomonas tetramitiformis]|uniref:CRAL-TRIO domain-containing protein n=1 Tax=Cymbomonas tetramitiformis TaxID=36881 RepID=A0AAE0GWS0_9CHLO|nr:hypothetical protein CYMTET_7542 [Cymbomonas tetramitiformis]
MDKEESARLFLADLKGEGYFRDFPELTERWFLKFLEAKRYDRGKAFAAVQSHCEWRSAWHIKGLFRRRLTHEGILYKMWPHYYLGRDVSNCPVVFMKLGELDITALEETHNLCLHDILMFHVKQQEFMRKLTEEISTQEGSEVERATYILDLTGVSMRRHLCTSAREFFQKLVDVDHQNFPEMLQRCLVINTSRIFPVIWSFAKSFVDARTRDKIEVFGSGSPDDEGGWAQAVRKLMGIRQGDSLPEQFDADYQEDRPDDGRFITENPLWSVLNYAGPVKPTKLKGKSKKGKRSKKGGSSQGDFESDTTSALDSSSVVSEDMAGISLQEFSQGAPPPTGAVIKPMQALQACLEAEGLLGAVEVKQNPKWACVHCKIPFDLHELEELQKHELACSREAAMAASSMRSSPAQGWLQRHMGASSRAGPSLLNDDDDNGGAYQSLSPFINGPNAIPLGKDDTGLLSGKTVRRKCGKLASCCWVQ